MSFQSMDREQITRYLLGQLPDEAGSTIEARYFEDPAYREVVEVVEDELTDAYVRGELSNGDARQFERYFLRSPERQRKLEMARALLRSSSSRQRFRPALRWAAALMIGAAGLTFWMLRREGSTPPALILTPGDRGLEQPKDLVIPSGTSSVSIRAEVESVRSGQVLRAVVRTIDEVEVLGPRVTSIRFSGGGASVGLVLPASLAGSDYILQIEALDSGSVWRVVGSYYLRIVRR